MQPRELKKRKGAGMMSEIITIQKVNIVITNVTYKVFQRKGLYDEKMMQLVHLIHSVQTWVPAMKQSNKQNGTVLGVSRMN